jgi:putative oxidoreductase
MSNGLNVGLLLLRLSLALLLAGHASQKLFGWFRGAGPAGTGAMFEQWGFRPGPAMAILAGLSEAAGAAAIALGLLTPGGCAVIIGTMIVAAAPNAPKGLWAHQGGCEVPVVYAGLGAVIAFTGPGQYSLDHAIGLTGFGGVGWGLVAVAVGTIAAVPPLLRRRTVLRHVPAGSTGAPGQPCPTQPADDQPPTPRGAHDES